MHLPMVPMQSMRVYLGFLYVHEKMILEKKVLLKAFNMLTTLGKKYISP